MLILALSAITAWGQSKHYSDKESGADAEVSFSELNKQFEGKSTGKGSGYKQFKRWEYFWAQRLFPENKFPEAYAIVQSIKNFEAHQAKKNPYNQIQAPLWKELGPVNVPENKVAYKSSGLGRISCIEFAPDDDDIIFAGSASGGLWKSTDFGQTWNNCGITTILSIGISDICVSKSNPSVIYAASGDANGSSSSRGFSVGILKSTDSGENWEITAFSREIKDRVLISRIVVDPANENRLLISTTHGIFKSTDGGQSWEEKLRDRNFRDILIHPLDKEILFSVSCKSDESKVYKSTDFGESWIVTQVFPDVSRIALSASRNSGGVFLLAVKGSTNGFGGFYASNDMGQSWQERSSEPNILGLSHDGLSPGGQGTYDLCLFVSPDDEDLIYSGGIHVWKSTNGGNQWEIQNHWTGSKDLPFLHADQHCLTMSPNRNVLFSGNDGGISYYDPDSADWINVSDGLGISQMYRLSCNQSTEEIVLTGTQDNGTNIFRNGTSWSHILGSDGMECIIDPENHQILYTTIFNGSIYKTVDGGNYFKPVFKASMTQESFLTVFPFCLNPEDSKIIIAGHENLWRSYDGGLNWEKISDFGTGDRLVAIHVCHRDSNRILAATFSTLYLSEDGGSNWSEIFSPPHSITSIESDPNNARRIWVTLSGYTEGEKVYELKDGKWENISGLLPNVPANKILYKRNSPDQLYLATDIGIFQKNLKINDWFFISNRLPRVVVNDLEINYEAGKIYAATFGRGLWQMDIPIFEDSKPIIFSTGSKRFCPGDSTVLKPMKNYDYYLWSTGETTKEITVTESGFYYLIAGTNEVQSLSNKIDIIIHPQKELIITAQEMEFCSSDSLRLEASPGFTKYFWSTSGNGSEIWIKTGGEFSVFAIDSNECYSYSEPVQIAELPTPPKPIITRIVNKLICSEALKYQWYFDGTEIAGQTGKEYVMQESGNFSVTVFDENNCSNWSEGEFFTLGVNDPGVDELLIYPNPADKELKLEFPNSINLGNPMKYELLNILGDIALVGELRTSGENPRATIDVRTLPGGAYMLKITINNKRLFKRVIIN